MLSNHTSDPIESQLREEALYKPYQSLNAYLKKKYGEKIYKIALDGGFTCPNRDGTCGTRGCIFCSAGGSGEFATAIRQNSSIDAQITQALARFGNKQTGQRFIAYFRHTPVRMRHLNGCMPCIIWRSPIRRSSGSLLPQDRTVCLLLSSM